MARISDLAKIEVPADNSVIPVSDGTITKIVTIANLKATIVKQASPTTIGSIRVGAGLAISDTGVLSVRNFSGYVLPPATADTLGGVRIGAGLDISETSVLSVNYSLPTASSSVLGGVKIGTGISMVNGTISVDVGNIPGGSLGAMPYQLTSDQTTLLPGNITTVRKFLAQTGTGTTSRAPVWTTMLNNLPIGLNSGTVVNVSVANGYLPVIDRNGVTTHITIIS